MSRLGLTSFFCVDPVLGTISWTAKNSNRAWVLGSGEKGKPWRVPVLGCLQCPFGQLRGLLLSRTARLRELKLPEKVQTACIIEELQELILEGYPVTLLRLWYKLFLNLRRAIRGIFPAQGNAS